MSKVYFTKELTPEAMVKMYDVLNVELKGKVAVKLHSGEVGNQIFKTFFYGKSHSTCEWNNC